MNNNLWTFGDSYAQYHEYEPLTDGWINQIERSINYKVVSHGSPGTSPHYTYNKFINCRNDFKENDIVIICLTSLYRKWFFFDKPNISSMFDNVSLKHVSTGEVSALKQYFKYLNYNDDFIEKINLYNFLNTVQRITEIKKIKTIIIPAFIECEDTIKYYQNEFPNIHFATGNISFDVSFPEFKFYKFGDEESDKLLLSFLSEDKRYCHMMQSNHTTLANKILNYINNGTAIDLKNGFIKKQIDITTWNDPEFINKELFGSLG